MKEKKLYDNIVFWLILIILFWEISSRVGVTNSFLLPPFSKVMKELWIQILKGVYLKQILNSILVIMVGLCISVSIGGILIILCNCSKIVYGFVNTLCVILTPLPGIAIMPIIIMLFGINVGSMIVLMLHSVLWPFITNVLSGFRSVPKAYTDFGLCIGLTRAGLVKDVYFFALIPHLIAGLKIGWGRAWRALISAEMAFGMIGKTGGIGYFISTNRAYGNLTRVMVGVMTVVIVGVIVEKVFLGYVEKVTMKKWGM